MLNFSAASLKGKKTRFSAALRMTPSREQLGVIINSLNKARVHREPARQIPDVVRGRIGCCYAEGSEESRSSGNQPPFADAQHDKAVALRCAARYTYRKFKTSQSRILLGSLSQSLTGGLVTRRTGSRRRRLARFASGGSDVQLLPELLEKAHQTGRVLRFLLFWAPQCLTAPSAYQRFVVLLGEAPRQQISDVVRVVVAGIARKVFVPHRLPPFQPLIGRLVTILLIQFTLRAKGFNPL